MSEKRELASKHLGETPGAAERLALEAAQDRLVLAEDAGCLALAIDTAESVGVKSCLDKMLAHQLASAHQLAMKLAGRAAMHINNAAYDGFGPERRTYHSEEAVRAAGASARMMDAFQKGLLTLHRLRSGGNQNITVTHLTATQGGQALVAGRVGGKDEK